MMMRAVVLDTLGGPETLRLAPMPVPTPRAAEVRVRVQAVGLNPVDYKLAASGYPAWTYPHILGLDVAGTVEAVGTQVTDWTPGEAVYYHGDLSRPGGYAEYAVAEAHAVARLPQSLTMTQAAAVPCAGFTAYQALHRRLAVQAGQTILVHGGAGGVGGFAVQLAREAGLRVLTTCSPENNDFVRRLGADTAIDYRNEDVAARVRELTEGRGVDAVVDTVSAESATEGLALLTEGGGIACVVGEPDQRHPLVRAKRLSIYPISLGEAHLTRNRAAQEDLARIGREMGTLLSAGRIDPMVTEVIGLEAIPEALGRLMRRHVRGKIVAML